MRVAAGILLFDRHGRFLLVRRSDTGKWATPAGHVEPGETAWQGARREFLEETGFSGPFHRKKLVDVLRTPNSEFYLFSAETASFFVPELDHEHTAFCWASFDRLPKPLHWGLKWLKR